MPLTDAELEKLRSFRRATRQVRDASIIDTGQTIDVEFRPDEPGVVDVFVRFLSEEPFRSLAAAIRLVYMSNEPAHFYSVCNLLHREGSEEVRRRVAALRAQWHGTLDDPNHRLGVESEGQIFSFSPREVFEHWLYGVVFHQDPERQEPLRHLAVSGHQFCWNVQATALQLAGRILDLDDVVADFLGEARVERI